MMNEMMKTNKEMGARLLEVADYLEKVPVSDSGEEAKELRELALERVYGAYFALSMLDRGLRGYDPEAGAHWYANFPGEIVKAAS